MTDAEIVAQVLHVRRLRVEADEAHRRANDADRAADEADKAARVAASDAKAAERRWCEARDYLAGLVNP